MIDENLLLEIVDNQHWEFPLSFPLILTPQDQDWGRFQSYLRLTQYINQDGKCLCQKELTNDCELHHALISRKDAMGLPNPEIIHSSFNTVLLHPNCHRRIRRSLCLIHLAHIFGLEPIQNWYQSVKMKSDIRQLEWLEEAT